MTENLHVGAVGRAPESIESRASDAVAVHKLFGFNKFVSFGSHFQVASSTKGKTLTFIFTGCIQVIYRNYCSRPTVKDD